MTDGRHDSRTNQTDAGSGEPALRQPETPQPQLGQIVYVMQNSHGAIMGATLDESYAEANTKYVTACKLESLAETPQPAVYALLQQRPGQWIHWKRFQRFAACAWRTRLSDARRIARADGGEIEWNRTPRRSAYRYLPYKPLGRDAATQIPRSWNTDGPLTPEFKLTPPGSD